MIKLIEQGTRFREYEFDSEDEAKSFAEYWKGKVTAYLTTIFLVTI